MSLHERDFEKAGMRVLDVRAAHSHFKSAEQPQPRGHSWQRGRRTPAPASPARRSGQKSAAFDAFERGHEKGRLLRTEHPPTSAGASWPGSPSARPGASAPRLKRAVAVIAFATWPRVELGWQPAPCSATPPAVACSSQFCAPSARREGKGAVEGVCCIVVADACACVWLCVCSGPSVRRGPLRSDYETLLI